MGKQRETAANAATVMPPTAEPPPEAAAPALSRFQTFSAQRLHRKHLVGAAYNPRTITDDEKKRLRKLLKRHGLFNALRVEPAHGAARGRSPAARDP